jgi:hypothetical protein
VSSLPAVFPLTIDVTRRQHIAMSGMKNVLDVIRIVRVVRGAKLMCVTVCVCVWGGCRGEAYKYGVFDCQSSSDTLSCAVFSYGDLRTYCRHCCVLICTVDSDVACCGGCTGSSICEVRVMVVPTESYITVSGIRVVTSDC